MGRIVTSPTARAPSGEIAATSTDTLVPLAPSVTVALRTPVPDVIRFPFALHDMALSPSSRTFPMTRRVTISNGAGVTAAIP